MCCIDRIWRIPSGSSTRRIRIVRTMIVTPKFGIDRVDLRDDPAECVEQRLPRSERDHALDPMCDRVILQVRRAARRYVVDAARVKGPHRAIRHAAIAQPLRGAVGSDRVLGVVGARGVEAALPAERAREGRSVEADQSDGARPARARR